MLDELFGRRQWWPLVEASRRPGRPGVATAHLHAHRSGASVARPRRHLLQAEAGRGYENLIRKLVEGTLRKVRRPDVATQPLRANPAAGGGDEDMQRSLGSRLYPAALEVNPAKARGRRQRPRSPGGSVAGLAKTLQETRLAPSRKCRYVTEGNHHASHGSDGPFRHAPPARTRTCREADQVRCQSIVAPARRGRIHPHPERPAIYRGFSSP